MLKIKKLSVAIDVDHVLDNINMQINAGEIHAILGPKHSGKSALVNVINGNDILFVSKGSVSFNKKNITDTSSSDRSIMGVFTIFQELPLLEGITNVTLLKAALKARNSTLTKSEIALQYKAECIKLGLAANTGNKAIDIENEFIKTEIAQLPLLKPKFLLLDEIDNNIEEDEFGNVITYIKEYLTSVNGAALFVSNNQKFLDLLQPTHVHVMVDGEIKAQGNADLYKRILDHGYSQLS